MMLRPIRCPALALVALLPLLAARPSAAQSTEGTLRGQVLNPSGQPVPDQRVTLHRVDQLSGAMVDSAVTDANGRFSVRVPAVADTNSVFFVATRWQGELYIGTPFKPPVPEGLAYVVTVGVNPVQMGPPAEGGAAPASTAGPAAAPTAGGGPGPARWFLVVVLGLVALGAVTYALLGSARERGAQRRRALLLRIADLDERAARAGEEEAADLRRERAELMAQLTGD